MPPFEPKEILRTLDRHGVRYVVIGGVTGTLVTSTAPVAVLAYHFCATPDGLECDVVAELEPPLDRLGASYLVPVRLGNASGATVTSIIRVLGTTPGTTVDFVPLGLTGGGPWSTAVIADGELVETTATLTATTAALASVIITASAIVLVAVLDGPGAALTFPRPLEAWASAVHAVPLEGWNVILRSSDAPVAMNGLVYPIAWLPAAMGAALAYDTICLPVCTLSLPAGSSAGLAYSAAWTTWGSNARGWATEPGGGW